MALCWWLSRFHGRNLSSDSPILNSSSVVSMPPQVVDEPRQDVSYSSCDSLLSDCSCPVIVVVTEHEISSSVPCWAQFLTTSTCTCAQCIKVLFHSVPLLTIPGFPALEEKLCTVVSRKSIHGQSTLQVCHRGGWVLFWLFPHLTMKECPHHVYSDLKPLKQILRHKITYNGITSSIKVESWRHTTLWTAWCDSEHSVARSAHCISYVHLRKDALYLFQWSITWSFLPEIRIALKAVVLKLHAKLAPGWALIRVNFDLDLIQEIGPKVGDGRSFVSGLFFTRLRLYAHIKNFNSTTLCLSKYCERPYPFILAVLSVRV